MSKLARVVADYLVAQVEAGAQAVQLFDSWVGALSPDDYREGVLPHVRIIFDAVRATGVPALHFGTGIANLLPLMKQAGGDVIGLDWRAPLDWAWQVVGSNGACGQSCGRRADGPDTSSTWGTASCRRRRWTTSRPSSIWFTSIRAASGRSK
jgi:hypothetical protein